jgi:preprotein translocase subunit YajC
MGFLGSMALPLVATMLLMYFLLMRPESRKRKDMEKLIAGLKKNDQVVTIGGIVGTVVLADPQSKYVTIRVDDNTKLKMLRSAIASVGAGEEAEAKS